MNLLALALLGCSGPDPATALPDPGHKVVHRLNRAEYDNTVRDLLGTSLRPARDFPPDDFGYGFDNVAAVLSTSPLHVELYERAADQMLDELFAVGFEPPVTQTWQAEDPSQTVASVGAIHDQVAWNLWTEGSVEASVWVEHPGTYTLGAWAFGQQAGEDPVRMAFVVDGVELDVVDVHATEGSPSRYETDLVLEAGLHDVGVAFLNDLKAPPDLDRNLIVDWLQLTGPHDRAREPSAGRGLVLVCDPEQVGEAECAEEIVRTFGRRAWRRPLTASEFQARMASYATARSTGGDWDEGVRTALRALLLSPHFLYRIEADPPSGSTRALDDFELASRLSYFVWSSTPDDALLDVAEAGLLSDPDVLEAEARRMLADRRAEALVHNLGGQWLGLRKVEEAQPSVEHFPDWDSGLQASLEEELERFLTAILLGDRPVLELLTSERTFVDARVAEHYGLALPGGPGFVEVTAPGRPGLLGKGGLLAALSYPTRTSPVVRGKWVLDNLLCQSPPPPPAGVEGLDEEQDPGEEPESLRERLEQHRADPVCASCHQTMDQLGFALEPFDGVGAHRTHDDDGLPIDASGVLPDGSTFSGPEELARVLAADPAVPECMVRKTFTYALGRSTATPDADALNAIERDFAMGGYRFTELVVAIVRSRPFRYRSAEEGP